VLPFGCSFATQQPSLSHLSPGNGRSDSSGSSKSRFSRHSSNRLDSRYDSSSSSSTTIGPSTKELPPRPRLHSFPTGSALVFKQLHIDVNVCFALGNGVGSEFILHESFLKCGIDRLSSVLFADNEFTDAYSPSQIHAISSLVGFCLLLHCAHSLIMSGREIPSLCVGRGSFAERARTRA